MIPLSSLTPFQENNMPWFPKKKVTFTKVAFTQKHSPNTCNPYKLPAHKHGRYWVPNLVQKWQKMSTAFVEIS